MKKYSSLLITIGVLTFSVVFSQENSTNIVEGRIADASSGDAVSNATVSLKNSTNAVTADSSGYFKIGVGKFPATLVISHTSYDRKEILIRSSEKITVFLTPSFGLIGGVVLASKGIPTKVKDAPFSVELLSLHQVRNLPSPGPYGAIVSKKGVNVIESSLTFKTPSTRGFNGSGSTRVNQLVDGMDNQAPGLNFFVGNFTGLADLDVESIEILPGASSALYGPGGMNGTLLINSKDPFKYSGFSISAKPGIMHLGKNGRATSSIYNDYSIRWAEKLNEKFAFKLNAQYLSATDWLANDSSNYLRNGTSGKLVAGNRMTDPNYDGVNIYGDETTVNMQDVANGVIAFATQEFITGFRQMYGVDPTPAQINGFLSSNPDTQPFYYGLQGGLIPDQNVSRTGYKEKDIIDPETKNIKFNGALHYKLSEKTEAILMGYWATGNSVYTDDNRYALKGIKIGQYKLEIKNPKWFFRSYTTQEDAGEAYSATVTTQYFNEAWKSSQQWYPEYVGNYVGALMQGATSDQAHLFARSQADIGRPEPGSTEFKQIFDQIRKTPIPNGGLFKEKSQLWMTEGQYTFGDAGKNLELIVGGNYKRYILNSDGTLFIDTAKAIGINEVGGYVQATRRLFHDNLTLIVSGRFDKNENFKTQFTPRFAALIKVTKDNNIRMSYQTAYRFPGNLSQWIRLDVGGDYLLLGGLPWVMNYMDAANNPVHQILSDGSMDPNPYIYKDFKPETMRSFEIGYKGVIRNKLLIDVYTYFGKYEDFIGRIGLYQPTTGNAYSIVVNSSNSVKTHGSGIGMDYRMKDNFSAFFNLFSDVITDVPSGFKSYFNSPKYRFNAGLANSGLGKNKKIGFNIMMRWQDAFEWEGELANGPVPSFTSFDAQVSYNISKVKSVIRLGGTNIFNKYYKTAFANPSVGGLYYLGFLYNL